MICRHNYSPSTQTTRWILKCSTTRWTNTCDIAYKLILWSPQPVKCGIAVVWHYIKRLPRTLLIDFASTKQLFWVGNIMITELVSYKQIIQVLCFDLLWCFGFLQFKYCTENWQKRESQNHHCRKHIVVWYLCSIVQPFRIAFLSLIGKTSQNVVFVRSSKLKSSIYYFRTLVFTIIIIRSRLAVNSFLIIK